MAEFEVEYSSNAYFDLARIMMETRFRFEVAEDPDCLEAHLTKTALAGTLPAEGTLRMLVGRAVAVYIDPAAKAESLIRVVAVKEHSTDPGDTPPPTAT